MSRIIMWNLVSVDGLFEGPNSWELDWHQLVLGEEFNLFALEQLYSADGLLFGRVTYEGMAAYWPTAQGEIADLMNSLPKFVFSRSLNHAEWSNTTLVRENAASEILKLKNQGTKNTLVFGSANLSATLMEHNLGRSE